MKRGGGGIERGFGTVNRNQRKLDKKDTGRVCKLTPKDEEMITGTKKEERFAFVPNPKSHPA